MGQFRHQIVRTAVLQGLNADYGAQKYPVPHVKYDSFPLDFQR